MTIVTSCLARLVGLVGPGVRVRADQSKDADLVLLTNTMSTILGLQISMTIPVKVVVDDSISGLPI